PDVGELAEVLDEVTSQALELEPDHPVLELVLRELGLEFRSAQAALGVSLVDVDQSDTQVGHRPVLGVEEVRGGRRPQGLEPVVFPRSAQQAPLLQGFDAREALSPRGRLTAAPIEPLIPTLRLEATHRQTPRLARELSPFGSSPSRRTRPGSRP